MEIYSDSEVIQTFALIVLGTLTLVLATLFLVWIARELIDWYKIMDKTERKFVFVAFLLMLAPLIVREEIAPILINYGFLFMLWFTVKAYQRIIKLEPRKSEISKLKEYIDDEEYFEAMIAQAKNNAKHGLYSDLTSKQ